jgi:hypothetical protein
MGIYGGCCQVVTALAYFAERSIEYAMKNDYLKKYKLIEVGSWFANHPEFDRQNDSEYARSIPIIVIGENNGIKEVDIRDNQVVMVPIFLLQIWFTLKMVNGSCIRNPSNNY